MQQTEEETAKKSSAAQPKIIETTIKNYCEHNYHRLEYVLRGKTVSIGFAFLRQDHCSIDYDLELS